MILKVSRFSRKNKIEPWVSYVQFAEGTSKQLATRLLGNKSNGISIKRATLEQVDFYDVPMTKRLKRYDVEAGQVVCS
jgi:hypothetical protein